MHDGALGRKWDGRVCGTKMEGRGSSFAIERVTKQEKRLE